MTNDGDDDDDDDGEEPIKREEKHIDHYNVDSIVALARNQFMK